MTEKPSGPASRTRSRITSGVGEETIEPMKPVQESETTKTKSVSASSTSNAITSQRLLSSYFQLTSTSNLSDSEVIEQAKLKTRSKSGKLYKSSLCVPSPSTKKAMERLSLNVPAMQNSLSNPTSVNKSNTNLINTNHLIGQSLDSVNAVNTSGVGANPTSNQPSNCANSNTMSHSGTSISVTSTTMAPITVSIAGNINTAPTVSYAHFDPNYRPFDPAFTPSTYNMQAAGYPLNTSVMPSLPISTMAMPRYTFAAPWTTSGAHNYSQPQTTQQSTDPVINMLRHMNDKLSNIQEDVRALKENQQEVNTQLSDFRYELEEQQEEASSQKKEINTCHDKVDILASVCINYEQKINDLTNKCTNLAAKNMRSELIIFGLQAEGDKSCIEIAKSFFTDKMEIQQPPNIIQAYWKGQGINKPMVVKLQNPSAKGLVFSQVTKLKDKTNSRDRPYRVNDHLPEELTEHQIRQRQIVVANRALNEGDRLNMSFKKGKLLIGGTEYKKKIEIPKIKELLDMDPETIKNVGELCVTQSNEVTEAGNRFRAYACKSICLADVRNAISHIRRKHPDSTHTIVAYRLAGLNKAYDEDYLDNSEHGMGRRILSQIIQKDATNITIIVLRHFSGIHIGNRRFEIVKNLVSDVMDQLEKEGTFKSVLPLRSMLNMRVKRQKPRPRRAATINTTRGARGGLFLSCNRFSRLDSLDPDSSQAFSDIDSVIQFGSQSSMPRCSPPREHWGDTPPPKSRFSRDTTAATQQDYSGQKPNSADEETPVSRENLVVQDIKDGTASV